MYMYAEFMKNFDMTIDKEDIVKMKEKKAIGLLEALNNLEKKCKIKKVQYNSEIKKIAISLLPEDYGTFETVLNLIEKLQKENKELKSKIENKDKYFGLITGLGYDGYYNRETSNGNMKDLADLIDELVQAARDGLNDIPYSFDFLLVRRK